MKVLLATHLGLCFGVRDALHLIRALPNPTHITIRGQLVHNPLVTAELLQRGFTSLPEDSPQLPATDTVLITAHGTSNRDRARLTNAGKTLVDTTCPLVKKAHAAALQLHADHRHVLLIAKRHHIETRGLVGDLTHFTILESLADVISFPYPRLGILSQTTAIESDVQNIFAKIRALNPHADLRFINTICQPTRDRQSALDQLLTRIDLLVVLGGRNSNNTLHLAQRAAQRNLPALHIEHPDELQESAFTPTQTIGLTAGTSTLPETLHTTHQRLLTFHQQPPPPSKKNWRTPPTIMPQIMWHGRPRP